MCVFPLLQAIISTEYYAHTRHTTEFSIVQFSRFNIVQYFIILNIVLDDIEHCLVQLSIFSAQF
jgi:hypothetical protein